MKKLLLTVTALISAVCLSASAQDMKVIEKYGDKTINGLIVAGAFDVQLSQEGGSRTAGAKVTVDSEIEAHLIFEFTDDGYVRLSYKDDMSKYFTRSRKKPQVWITVSDMQYLNVTGACNVVFTSPTTTPNDFRLFVSGNANIELMEVRCEAAAVQMSGTSNVNDAKLTAPHEIKVELAGTAKFKGELKTGLLLLTQAGMSGITATGGAEQATLDLSGKSNAHLQDFNIGTVGGKVGGVSRVRASVSAGGQIDVATAASFRYTGDGLVTGKGVKRLD